MRTRYHFDRFNVLDFGPSTSSKLKLSWDNKYWESCRLVACLQPCSWENSFFPRTCKCLRTRFSFKAKQSHPSFQRLWTCRFGLKWVCIGVLKSFWVIFSIISCFIIIKLRVFIDVTTQRRWTSCLSGASGSHNTVLDTDMSLKGW